MVHGVFSQQRLETTMEIGGGAVRGDCFCIGFTADEVIPMRGRTTSPKWKNCRCMDASLRGVEGEWVGPTEVFRVRSFYSRLCVTPNLHPEFPTARGLIRSQEDRARQNRSALRRRELPWFGTDRPAPGPANRKNERAIVVTKLSASLVRIGQDPNAQNQRKGELHHNVRACVVRVMARHNRERDENGDAEPEKARRRGDFMQPTGHRVHERRMGCFTRISQCMFASVTILIPFVQYRREFASHNLRFSFNCPSLPSVAFKCL